MKNAILVYWKGKKAHQIYSSLAGFMERNNGYSLNKLVYHLTRKRIAYEDDRVIIRRVEYVTRMKQ